MGPGALPSGKWGLTFGSERWKCFLSPYTFQGSRQVGQPSERAAELWLLPSPSARCSWAVSLRPPHPACAQLGLLLPCPPRFSCLGRNRDGACSQRPCVCSCCSCCERACFSLLSFRPEGKFLGAGFLQYSWESLPRSQYPRAPQENARRVGLCFFV